MPDTKPARSRSRATAKPAQAAPQTPEAAQASPQTPEGVQTPAQTPERDHDIVVAVSVRADGTPDQTPGFRVIGQDDERA